MNVSPYNTKDYENESAFRAQENKAKQSQSAIGGQVSEDRRQKSVVYPPVAGQKPALLALRSLIVSGEAGSAAEWVRNDRPDKAQLLGHGNISANIKHRARL